jgi:hypothetical protein
MQYNQDSLVILDVCQLSSTSNNSPAGTYTAAKHRLDSIDAIAFQRDGAAPLATQKFSKKK